MLTPADFNTLVAPLTPFERAPRIAVAVSGGPDSVALFHLTVAWAAQCGGSVLALTVDHGLRPEAADEAKAVAELSVRLGACHRTLVWSGDKPATGIQEAARSARYALLGQACAKEGILHLVTAHHHDDQIETVLMRSQRQSGPDGLAGMSLSVPMRWGRIIRPLLPVPKAMLLSYCEAMNLGYADDPSNRDHRFTRVRLRHERRAEDDAQASADIEKRGEQRTKAEFQTAADLAQLATLLPAGGVALDMVRLLTLTRDRRARILRHCLRRVGQRPYPPRSDRFARLLLQLSATEEFRTRTLSGCILSTKSPHLLIRPEAGRDGRVDRPPAANFQVAPPWTRIT